MTEALSNTPALARRIELWPTDKLRPYAKNARTHSPEQVAQIAASIAEFGFNVPILVDSSAGIIAGHGRLLAARKLGLAEVPVVVLDHLSETQRRAYVIADNRLSELAGWDQVVLAAELRDLEDEGLNLALVGFSDEELEALLDEQEQPEKAPDTEETVPIAPADAVSRPGDVWIIGRHRLICGDCRDMAVIPELFGDVRANVCVTSPPYATQREYDPSSGFRPVPPEQYVDWFRAVAAGIESVLAPDGSYFLNIKEHAEDGERHLYVKDLVIAHRRQWGWRFVDEFCWRKTDNGVPGGWNNRFKNAWEPMFHFSRQQQIKFRPKRVGHESEDCFDYSPNNPKSASGSGLLGTGARGSAAGKPGATDNSGRYVGVARPSNVVEVKSESSQGSHSAPFPRALVEFFVLAFSDSADVIFDPFMGSGTTMAAAALLDRAGYGCEISPGYCDVVLRRMMDLTGDVPVLAATGDVFVDVAAKRGVSVGGVEPEAAGFESHQAQWTEPALRAAQEEGVLRTDIQIEKWPVERLIPYARNARTHTDEQVAQIAASIAEFGWTNPLLIGADGIIIAGHARLAAARKLRTTEVPVIVLDHLSETQRRALVLADNRLALNAGWDEEMLRVELESLKESDFDLDLVGFTEEELEQFLAEPEQTREGLTDEDAVPEEPEQAVTKPGDLWILGEHRLLCGDATQLADVEKVLGGELADMVFTDSPYNVDYTGKTAKKLKIGNDALGGKFYDFLREACANMLAVTKGAIYMCMSSSELHTLFRAFRDAGGHWSTFVIWAKHHFTLGRSDYQRQYEPILYGWRDGTDHFWCGDRNQGDVWFIKRPMANLEHPTMKPVELVERALRNSSKSRDTILDPFGGSGTTVIACEKAGRRARVIELDPKYCDVTIRRYMQFSGKPALLENGRTFDEVGASRSDFGNPRSHCDASPI